MYLLIFPFLIAATPTLFKDPARVLDALSQAGGNAKFISATQIGKHLNITFHDQFPWQALKRTLRQLNDQHKISSALLGLEIEGESFQYTGYRINGNGHKKRSGKISAEEYQAKLDLKKNITQTTKRGMQGMRSDL